MLQLIDIAVGAGEKTLLAGLGVDLAPGELLALRGPSGCGKTTLLRAINGLSDPLAGTVQLDGESPDGIGWPAYRRQVALVGQRPVLLEGSVLSNLERPFSYHSAGSVFPHERCLDLLQSLGFTAGHLKQEARSLSEGEQQRISLVRVLLIEPQVLLLDEPTSALDEKAVERVESLIRDETLKNGLAALVVTHDRSQADRWCDRTIDLVPYLTQHTVDGTGDPV
jgi:ABC-type iron transport system FetAB ATPase subunit